MPGIMPPNGRTVNGVLSHQILRYLLLANELKISFGEKSDSLIAQINKNSTKQASTSFKGSNIPKVASTKNQQPCSHTDTSHIPAASRRATPCLAQLASRSASHVQTLSQRAGTAASFFFTWPYVQWPWWQRIKSFCTPILSSSINCDPRYDDT